MKCPVCSEPLREKGAAVMTIDVCYGGCGGIWFDAKELSRVDATAAATLHTIWQNPQFKVVPSKPRLCPRCPSQPLTTRWFSDARKVEIDQCPKCHGVWLDAGEFSRICQEVRGARIAPPRWAVAMAEAAASLPPPGNGDVPPSARP